MPSHEEMEYEKLKRDALCVNKMSVPLPGGCKCLYACMCICFKLTH